jgi:hypothetical protein
MEEFYKSLNPCEEVLKSGKRCGKTPTQPCRVSVSFPYDNDTGARTQDRVFFFCDNHSPSHNVEGREDVDPNILERWIKTIIKDER